MLAASYVKDNHRNWDQVLVKVAFAIRSARHEVTNFTPNFLNFGRQVQIAGAWETNDETPIDPESMIRQVDVLHKVYQGITMRLKAAYEKSCHSYKLSRREETFGLNQRMWKRNPVLSDATKGFTAKLAPKYVCVYTIKKILWTYELMDKDGNNFGV